MAKNKNLKTCFVACLLLSFVSCGAPKIPEIGTDYKYTAGIMDGEMDPEDIYSIIYGGPLYVMNPKTATPTLKAYRELKMARVNEMKELMKEERKLLGETLKAIPEFRSNTITFLTRLADLMDVKKSDEAKLKIYAMDIVDKLTEQAIKTEMILANMDGLGEALEEGEMRLPGPLSGMFWYSQYIFINELVDSIRHELSYVPAKTAGIIVLIGTNKDRFAKDVFKLAGKFDKKIGSSLKKTSENFGEALQTYLDIAVGFESLKAAEYAFTRAMLDYAAIAVSDMQELAEKIQIRGGISQEDKSFYRSYTKFLKAYTDTIREEYKSVKEPRYLSMVEPVRGVIPSFGVRCAHAGLAEWLDKTAAALTGSVKKAGQAVYGATSECVGRPWQCTKDAVVKTVQDTQKAIGYAVDTVNIVVGTGMDVTANVYYGNNILDVKEIVAENYGKMMNSWEEGKPGAETLRTAADYVDGVEKFVGEGAAMVTNTVLDGVESGLQKVTGGYVKNVWGKETITWTAGKLGEITTNMLTGAGKGLLLVSNPDASKDELIEGGMEVAFAFIGGSKSVVKGSQVVSGVKELGKEVAEKGAKQVGQLQLRMQKDVLRGSTNKILKNAADKLSPEQIQTIYSNTKAIYANEMKEQLMKETEKKVTQLFSEGVGKGMKTVFGNLKEVPQSYRLFVKEQFENSMKGYMGAAKAIFGGTMKEYGDNVFGNIMNTVMKEFTKSMVPETDKEIIQTAEDKVSLFSGMNLASQELQNGLQEAMNIIAEATKEMTQIEDVASAMAESAVTQELINKVEEAVEEVEEALSMPVSARGSFSGDYSGSVSMTLVPGGGSADGTVTTKYGTADINGTITKEGGFSASVNGAMTYDEYEKDGSGRYVLVKKSCSLKARMNGIVKERIASGSYSGSCAKENDSGSWTVSW